MPTDASGKPASQKQQGAQPETIKETLISIMIAFTMAFVFRGFVVEAFVIPTGSMAPTLMGAHMQVRGPETGVQWPIGAFQPVRGDPNSYVDPQVSVPAQDPISGETFQSRNRRTYSGDRILVLKYLYAINDPKRFDVIVFKNPQNTADNYIKRLIGLPGEQIALADGDVFVRTTAEGRDPGGDQSADGRTRLWEQAGWSIARKDPITQRSVWQMVYDSANTPIGKSAVAVPWRPGEDLGWTMGEREYRYAGTNKTDLVFDQTRPRWAKDVPLGTRSANWAIDDYYPYNEPYYENSGAKAPFPVSDVRLRCGFKPEKDGESIGFHLSTRGHEFRATIGAGKVEIGRRAPAGAAGAMGPWEVVATQTAPALAAGVVSNVEFWHVDQSVQVWLDGKQLAHFEYAWSPGQRIHFATGKPLGEFMARQAGDKDGPNVLAYPDLYQFGKCADVRFTFEGGPFTLWRVGLDRDLYYQPVNKPTRGAPSGIGTNPFHPLVLSNDQLFACGDNSPMSLDGRMWETVDPWVDEAYPPPPGPYPSAGVIPRELLLGKAFFVYWPSLKYEGNPVPVPDFGRMRFIW